MKTGSLAIGCAASLMCGAVCAGVSPERIEWFKDQKLALMMHFGLYSQPGIIESWPLSDRDAYWSRVEVERDVATNGFKEAYFALNRSFNPVWFRPDEWAFTRGKDGTVYAIRMWGETTPATTMFIRRNALTDKAKVLRHLTTGESFPLRQIDNPALGEFGMAFDLPAGFQRDKYADVFVVEDR